MWKNVSILALIGCLGLGAFYHNLKMIEAREIILVTNSHASYEFYKNICNISKAKGDPCDTVNRGSYAFLQYYKKHIDAMPMAIGKYF